VPGGTEKNTNNLSHDSQSPGQDLNSGPPKYEAGMRNYSTVMLGNYSLFLTNTLVLELIILITNKKSVKNLRLLCFNLF
jgi:hypothetical protein